MRQKQNQSGRTAIIATVSIGLGAVVLGCIVFANRGNNDRSQDSVSVVRTEINGSRDGVSLPSASVPDRVETDPLLTNAPVVSQNASPETRAIVDRIAVMQDRLSELAARKQELEKKNEDVRKKITQKQEKARRDNFALSRVNYWKSVTDLTKAQEEELTRLWEQWYDEEQVTKPDQAAWMAREDQVRSLLSNEQKQKIHDNVQKSAEQYWGFLPNWVGSIAKMSDQEKENLQASLPAFSVPGQVLFRKAHNMDWAGVYRSGYAHLKGYLNAEQQAAVEKHMSGWN